MLFLGMVMACNYTGVSGRHALHGEDDGTDTNILFFF